MNKINWQRWKSIQILVLSYELSNNSACKTQNFKRWRLKDTDTRRVQGMISFFLTEFLNHIDKVRLVPVISTYSFLNDFPIFGNDKCGRDTFEYINRGKIIGIIGINGKGKDYLQTKLYETKTFV